jgi:hypothetical protein
LSADGFDGTIYLENEDGSFFMVVSADTAFMFDMMGGAGNPDEFTTPRQLMGALTAADTTDASALVIDHWYGANQGAVLGQAEDGFVLGVLDVNGRLVIFFGSVDPTNPRAYQSLTDNILSSLRFEAG